MDGPATESCSFSDDATVAVVLNPSSTVEGGSTVTLRGGLLKANTARLTYQMNVAVVRTADEQFQDMLDLAVPNSEREA